jgi:glycosidase
MLFLPILALIPAAAPHAVVRAVQTTDAPRDVTFTYTPKSPVRSVNLAGQFNGWSATATPMRLNGDSWTVTLPLTPGVYQYKFVLNGGDWIVDPSAPSMDDGNGNRNSVLTVVPEEYANTPGMVGDAVITRSGIKHEISAAYVKRLDRARFSLVLRTRKDDVQSCSILQPGVAGEIPMVRYASDPLYDYWHGTVAAPTTGSLRYAFAIRDGRKRVIFDTGGFKDGAAAPRWVVLDPARFPALITPEWARDAVFYQIFPDRFANGDPSNDPPDVRPWGSPPNFRDWQGGDLAGVMQHMDYLNKLGINAIYFNPLFKTTSNHGYETVDYQTVDPRFGTNQQLKQLVNATHARGWHVILDGVFALTGIDFFAFKSLREQGSASPYRNWYFIHSFPIEVKQGETSYTAYFNFPSMPKLNQDNPETRSYLLDVATRWIRDAGIDGWRLDSADQVPHDYWKDFRKAVRGTRKDAYIVGEIWPNASDWLQGDQFDSVMNYRWRGAALDFFAQDRLSPTQFDHALAQIRDDYPIAATDVMFNMLDSHDTERLRNSCGGDERRQKQAVLFQMTYPGTPCVYYGDEIGMEGGHDPDDRRAMPWDSSQWNMPLLAFYRRVIHLRDETPALRRGDFQTILSDDPTGAFAYLRILGRERVLVVFNRSDSPRIVPLPAAACAGLHPENLTGGTPLVQGQAGYSVTLPPRGSGVFSTRPVPSAAQ